MAEPPVYRCRCGEVFHTADDASVHADEDHAYAAVPECDAPRCEVRLAGEEMVVVHHGGVYCCGACARHAARIDATPHARGETP